MNNEHMHQWEEISVKPFPMGIFSLLTLDMRDVHIYRCEICGEIKKEVF